MNTSLHSPLTGSPVGMHLQRKAHVTVDDAAGLTVLCEQGTVWITLDNDPRDIVLEAGASFRSDAHQRAIVYALDDTHLWLAGAPHQGAARPAGLQ